MTWGCYFCSSIYIYIYTVYTHHRSYHLAQKNPTSLIVRGWSWLHTPNMRTMVLKIMNPNMTAHHKSPSLVGKYLSTMEHMGHHYISLSKSPAQATHCFMDNIVPHMGCEIPRNAAMPWKITFKPIPGIDRNHIRKRTIFHSAVKCAKTLCFTALQKIALG